MYFNHAPTNESTHKFDKFVKFANFILFFWRKHISWFDTTFRVVIQKKIMGKLCVLYRNKRRMRWMYFFDFRFFFIFFYHSSLIILFEICFNIINIKNETFNFFFRMKQSLLIIWYKNNQIMFQIVYEIDILLFCCQMPSQLRSHITKICSFIIFFFNRTQY